MVVGGVRVRAIEEDELGDWVGASLTAFHGQHGAAEEVRLRREVLRQPTPRTLGAFDGTELVGTLHTFPTQLSVPGETVLQADAVTSASVLPTHRRRGILRQLLTCDLHAARARDEVASVLIAAEYPIYGRFGYGPATQHTTVTLAARAAFTNHQPLLGHVELVERQTMLELAPPLFDAFRRGCPGQISREAANWQLRLGIRPLPWLASPPTHFAVYRDEHGQAQGYLLYHVDGAWERRLPRATLQVDELIARTPAAYMGLWRYCSEVDLLSSVRAGLRRVDEPLPWLLDNPRADWRELERVDFLWLRLLDTPAALGARRYATEDELVLEVSDPLDVAGGRFLLHGSPHGATVHPTERSADLTLSMAALGALLLGGTSWHLLAAAGWLSEQRPGTLDRAQALFGAARAPWCSTFF